MVRCPQMMYSQEQLEEIDPQKVPHHVAVIMDGNRRWAQKRHLPVIAGHFRGAHVLTNVVRAASELGIKVLTVFAFSTENWQRDPQEVSGLMNLIKHYLTAKKKVMIAEGVRLQTIGDLEKLPSDVQEAISKTKQATHTEKATIDLVLALNYGGRDDIRRALVVMMRQQVPLEHLTEEVISQYLDTSAWPDPDLLIRTSGERRQSNFLLWQLSYSEFYHTDVLWPDFDEMTLLGIVKEYQKRNRRLGG